MSAIRAVNVDGVMKTLVTRGLVTEVGHDEESGAVLYATTEYFLQRLGISSLDELPPVADYLPAELWIDGSMLSDVPAQRVGRLHNVNHFIVSQTNPLVLPFVPRKRGVGAGTRKGGDVARRSDA